MKSLFKEICSKDQAFLELRYHRRSENTLTVQKGRVDEANHAVTEGVGVRALVDGTWGFAATADPSKAAIQKAIAEAKANASVLSGCEKSPVSFEERSDRLASCDIIGNDFTELKNMPISDKLGQVVNIEKKLLKGSQLVSSAKCRYSEILEEKTIVTSDGAEASMSLAQPEIYFVAYAEEKGERTWNLRAAGVNGGWQCLFSHPTIERATEETVKTAVDLLHAKYPEGGQKTVVLAPALVGLLCHEAVGHTVEADFVKAGSVAQGKLGQRVASDLVTLVDSGCETLKGYGVGNIPFDDEGIQTDETIIIKNGILNSYLHNRETAKEFGTKPTGNARAWLYSDQPLIRMRNTYILPGTQKLEQMIAEIEDGYLVDGVGSGQADSNGEFMFGTGFVWLIKNGKKTELLREATLSGIAFDVLKTVDAVSEEFRMDLGFGLCGKGQPAKVDAGGPYVRCKIKLGGRQ